MPPFVPRYIGRPELLKQLGISKATLLRWSKKRGFPAALPASGKMPIYDLQEVDAWLRNSPNT
ncbi:helix-turn-helix transcriptional regulator [uncultured Roseovarius sp.]|uniref:helix-turn-helix transcriptional regulator n=1 Tax=uncultured Roseovarius sp. TaxID=293344 RepID=UPI00345BFFEF